MQLRPTLHSGLVFGLFASLAVSAGAQGRKYKAPPPTSHIQVTVLKNSNQKPIANAAVVFRATKDGKSEGDLEVKTNEDGQAVIDVIATGSSVDVQVIADGFATFAGTYQVDEPDRAIEIHMIKPRAQISTYIDTRGEPAQRPPGIQEPAKPQTPPAQQTTPPAGSSLSTSPGGLTYTPSKPATTQPGIPVQTNPPNMHPDNQYPVDPAAPPQNPRPPATPPQN